MGRFSVYFSSGLLEKLHAQEQVDIFFKKTPSKSASSKDLQDPQEERFGAHSLILTAASSTFADFLKSQPTTDIELPSEISMEKFKKLLDCIYGGEPELASLTEAIEVYKIASTFDFQRPMEYARKRIRDNFFETDTVTVVFALIYEHQDERLKKMCEPKLIQMTYQVVDKVLKALDEALALWSK